MVTIEKYKSKLRNDPDGAEDLRLIKETLDEYKTVMEDSVEYEKAKKEYMLTLELKKRCENIKKEIIEGK
jgi:hypothetical protein